MMPVADRQLVTFFCVAKRKLPKKKRPRFVAPVGVPCVPQPNRALRNSRYALKLVCELCALDSDSRSVEREVAHAAARNTVKLGAIVAVPAPQASLTMSRQAPLFGFVTWRLTGDIKNTSCRKLF
jgi:hypothetical protein